MWIFMNDSFLSVVENRADPSTLLIRARVEEDIERAIGRTPLRTPVTRMFEADYPFRATISKVAFAELMAQRIHDISYHNFKDTVTEYKRHKAYSEVWMVMISMFQTVDSYYKRLMK